MSNILDYGKLKGRLKVNIEKNFDTANITE